MVKSSLPAFFLKALMRNNNASLSGGKANLRASSLSSIGLECTSVCFSKFCLGVSSKLFQQSSNHASPSDVLGNVKIALEAGCLPLCSEKQAVLL